MTDIVPLMPRRPVPDLSVPLVGGGLWHLAERQPRLFTMLVFYRGYHCPLCRAYLADLQDRLDEFEKRGVEALALSSDPMERGLAAKSEWRLHRLPLAAGLTLEQGRSFGLYISAGRGKTSAGVEEPALFTEPGLFLVRPDRTLYFAAVQTMPFTRPAWPDLLRGIDAAITRSYPARGEVADWR